MPTATTPETPTPTSGKRKREDEDENQQNQIQQENPNKKPFELPKEEEKKHDDPHGLESLKQMVTDINDMVSKATVGMTAKEAGDKVLDKAVVPAVLTGLKAASAAASFASSAASSAVSVASRAASAVASVASDTASAMSRPASSSMSSMKDTQTTESAQEKVQTKEIEMVTMKPPVETTSELTDDNQIENKMS